MKKYGILGAISAAMIALIPVAALAGGTMDVTVTAEKMPAPDMIMQPAKKYYKFDAKAALAFFKNKTSSLQEVTCPSDVLLKQAGLVGTSKKWTYATYEDTVAKMNISYDFVGCTFNGYSSNTDANYTANLKPITEKRAIQKAKEFIEGSFIKDVMGKTLGEPIVTSKYNAMNPMPMPIDARSSEAPVVNEENYIDKDEYTSISIMFPYVVDGKKVYSNYGGRLGLTIEVNEKGINSYYGQIISTSGIAKDAKPMTNIQFIAAIKRGGNNQYYGPKSTVTLGQPERIITLVNDWRNGKNTNYLATATLFPTTMAVDTYAPWMMYEMVLADYRFANPSMGWGGDGRMY